ncbi:cytidine deaminase [Lactobacillus sp. ESL0684]|uniref:cytidine deaminase family protein n=1 Tax=Lactobacillus sp. ESL0684 TaxID=2983213 RepID=UPI0023F8735E|nr:cytidine deaminase [Lactobacillus sp. ESL0684]WEV43902.1 cytidine deaminase [Lactobacillus sp. ESL0684]
MDIWQKLYQAAKVEYHPQDVTPFIYAHNVVSALEAADGQIFVGFCVESCSGVLDLCAERVAALNMYVNSGQTQIKRIIAFRDQAPSGSGSGMPCGACREYLMQLDERNRNLEFMVDYQKRQTITLNELMPNWWGNERYQSAKQK